MQLFWWALVCFGGRKLLHCERRAPAGVCVTASRVSKAGPGRKAMHAAAAVTRRHDFDLLLGALSPCGRARRVALAARVDSH